MPSSSSQSNLPSRSASQPVKLQRRQSTRLPTPSTTPSSPEQYASLKSPTARLETDHASPPSQGAAGYQNTAAAKDMGKHALRRQRSTGPVASPPTLPSIPSSTTRLPRFDAAVPSTPSPASGSTPASASQTPRRLLRKKASSIGKPALHSSKGPAAEHKSHPSESMGAIRNEHGTDMVLGIVLPQPNAPLVVTSPASFEHGTPRPDGTEPLVLPLPNYATSTSPSSRYSESPGRFSHSSSPTSISSHSPGIVFSSKLLAPRARRTSPVRSRPPPVRRVTEGDTSLGASQGLPSVRESFNSSSSASTVVPLEIKETQSATISPLKPTGRYHNGTSLSPEQQSRPRPTAISIQTRMLVDSTHAAPVYPPPELAHLADAPPAQSTAKPRPTRPSREGTPDLSRFQQPSPIVQSNLTSLPGRHRPQISAGSSVLGSGGPSNSSRTTLSPTKSHFDSSPNPSLNSAFSPVSFAPTTRGTTPELSDGERGLRSGASPTAPNARKSPYRFGFFTKRHKTEPVVPLNKERKLLRKGPIAGTGHEGYGKYAGRGRGATLTSVPGSLSRSTSADSNNESTLQLQYIRKGSVATKSEPEMDGFYRDRLAPRVLRGRRAVTDSVSTNSEAGRSGSSLDSTHGRPSLEGRNDSTAPTPEWKSGGEWSRPKLLPSAMPAPVRSVSPFQGPESSHRRPSGDANANGFHPLRPQRAGQLPSQDTRIWADGDEVITPLDRTDGGPHIPRLAHHEDVSEGREGNWLKPKKRTLQQKSSRKWNFFQWAQTNSPLQTEDVDMSPVADEGIPNEPARSMPHYALQDGDDQLDMVELERIMQEAVRAGETPMSSRPPSLQFTQAAKQQHESVLLPSPPMIPTRFSHTSGRSSPKVYLKHPEWPKPESSNVDRVEELPDHNITRSPSPTQMTSALSPISSPLRPGRLAQVGRIPPVISQKDRQRRMSNRSFSRPFARAQPSPALHPPPLLKELIDTAANILRPDCPHGDEDPQKGMLNPRAKREPSLLTEPYSAGAEPGPAESVPEFFAFPRKYSELSYSSTSSFAASTAVVPPPGAPLQEDEVWNEYDDLIEDVLSSPEDRVTKLSADAGAVTNEQSKEDVVGNTAPIASTSAPKQDTLPVTSSDNREVSVHLRRSRLLAAFQALATPSMPDNMSECMAEEDQACNARLNLPSLRLGQTPTRPESASSRISESAMEDPPQQSSKSTTARSSTAPPAGSQQRDSRLVKVAESQEDGVSMANLRFGALMTSKWLSFGRVLFSPAHNIVKFGHDNAVLVLDGLGNDWSYYCALSYPTASIYNLTSSPSSPSLPNPHTTPLGNHHPIHHASLTAPFPFPQSFFAAVILRFPPLAPASVYKSLVAECKRVLRPGGFLELSVLDLDARGMGNRGRRAVRGLKVRLAGAGRGGRAEGEGGQGEEEAVCLRPRCDGFLRLVGRRGFVGVRMCLVGVPVVSPAQPNANTTNNTPHTTIDKDEQNMSSTVSKVGRWWYRRCFESNTGVGSGVQTSIWDDEALVRECERRGTSFRLLVCCAQKSEKVVRRTVSV